MENLENIFDKSSFNEEYNYKNKKLWNPTNFVILSAFFSFLPASILYSLNYGRVGNIKKRNIFLILSITIFIITVTLATIIKPQIASLFTALNIGFGIYARSSQIDLFKNHISNGGKKASYVLPTICSFLVAGLVIWAMIYSFNIPDKMNIINGDELYYTEKVNDIEIEKLKIFLEDNQIMVNDKNKISIKIDKSKETYLLSFVIAKEYFNDKDTTDYFKSLGEKASVGVFENKTVKIQYCDDRFNVLKTIE